MNFRFPLLLPWIAVLLASGVQGSPVAAGDLWEVGGPNPDFAEIQGAVSVLQDGDVVRVWPGIYQVFSLANVEVHVVAETPGSVEIQGQVRIRDVDAGKTVVLSGLRAVGSDSGGAVIQNCQGAVRLEDCAFIGLSASPGSSTSMDGLPGLRVLNCEDVAMVAGSSTGGSGSSGSFAGNPGGAGVQIENSQVSIHGTLVLGGNGGSTLIQDCGESGGAGGPGIQASQSTVYLSGAVVEGGRGGGGCEGSSFLGLCGNGGTGGDALQESGSIVRILGSLLTPGSGGQGGCCECSQGADGSASSGTVVGLTGSAKGLEIQALGVEGSGHLFRFFGEPGDLVQLAVSLNSTHAWLPALNGDLLVGAPFLRERYEVGTVPGAGILDWTLFLQSVPVLSTSTLRVQPLFFELGGSSILGPARTVSILDSAL